MHVINYGACINLRLNPDLVDAYGYWKKLGTFDHTPKLMRHIEEVIHQAKHNNCSFDATGRC